MINISDNWKGEDTYNKWCPPVSGKKERPYKANIGEKSSRIIELLPKPISKKEQPSKTDSTKSSTTHETFTLGPYPTKKNILTKENILNLRPIIYKPSDIRNDNNEVLHVKCSSTHIPRENPPQITSNKKRLLLLSYIAIKNNLDNLIGLYEEVRAEYFATYGNDFNTQLIDSYCKKISALKEQYCSSHHRLKNMYEELLRHFGDISLADNNIKQFFNITGKIIEYISIENILSKQFIFKDFVKLNKAFNYYYFKLCQ